MQYYTVFGKTFSSLFSFLALSFRERLQPSSSGFGLFMLQRYTATAPNKYAIHESQQRYMNQSTDNDNVFGG
jgi:hypothetical protein